MTEQGPMQTRKLKIALFHFGFFYSGGGEKLVLEEVKGLRRMGHEVTCFAPYVDRRHCFPDWPEIREIKTLLPPPPQWLPLNHAIWVLACCLLIPLMALRFRKFDVFFGANQPAPWLTYVLGKILGKPYVIYLAQPFRLLHPREVDRENGLRIQDGDQRFVRLLTKYATRIIDWADRVSVKSADIVLTNGEYVSQWINGIYEIESVVCAAGCHPLDFAELDYGRRLRGSLTINGYTIPKPFMLLTNRHSPMKRFEYSLWALKSITRECPNVSLVITGQPTQYTSQLSYLAEGLGLEHKVIFVGLVNEIELRRLYSEASLYVYTSPQEDFGMGIIEAMAAGTPVIAWRRAGPTVTVIDNETGFLVTPYDSDEFAEKMKVILSNPELAERMGQAGHRRVEEMFTYEHHNRKLEWALVQSLLRKKIVAKEEKIPVEFKWIQK
ncbi:MAG: glycosyltransferase family 4 protein [Desulfobacteraceae bacterium]|nr:glycosyltransferase family 4 protein [Desulfobacteraceae bacterium]